MYVTEEYGEGNYEIKLFPEHEEGYITYMVYKDGEAYRYCTAFDENNEPYRTPLLDENGNEQYIYSLRYEEFIALNTAMIQDLILEVDALKEDMEDLKEKVNSLIG